MTSSDDRYKLLGDTHQSVNLWSQLDYLNVAAQLF